VALFWFVFWFVLAGFVILAVVALALYSLTLLPPIIAIALIAIWAVNAINRGRQIKPSLQARANGHANAAPGGIFARC
jgi:uncharacterized membrane protein YdfJ with MMPL/SSD domain